MKLELLDLNGEIYIVTEFSVRQALGFIELESTDAQTFIPSILNVCSPVKHSNIIPIIENAEKVIEVIERLNPDLFNDAEHISEGGELDEKVIARAKRSALILKSNILKIIADGHPNLLEYPFSLYVHLINMLGTAR